MKITIKGSSAELAELAKVLGGTENEEKNADFPPLLTELAENKKTNLFFGDAHGQTGDEFAETIRHNRETISIIKKMNEVAKQRKENAPQEEAAEQGDKVGIAKQSINNLRKMISEKTAEFFDEYINAVSNASDAHATFNHCFYLRKSAHEIWKMISKSVIANIWDCDTLFL